MATTTLQAESANSTICSLLPAWADAWERGLAFETDDIDYDCTAEAWKVLQEIMTAPAASVEDMAIKAYLSVHYELGSDHRDPVGINWDGGIMNDSTPHRALVADAVRFSPTLARVIASGKLHTC